MSFKRNPTLTLSNFDFWWYLWPGGYKNAIPCPVHGSPCFLAEHTALTEFMPCGTSWHLNNPINVSSWLPGTGRKLVSLLIKGMYFLGPATIVDPFNPPFANMYVKADQALIWSSGIIHGEGQWLENLFPVNKSLAAVSQLELQLDQAVACVTGYAGIHDAYIQLTGEYYTDIPPERGDLEVTVNNAETGQPLKGIHVRVNSGTIVIRDGHTDGNGRVSWSGVDENTYSLKVFGVPPSYFSGGFEGWEQAVTVVPNVLNSINVTLVPIPKLPLEIPWYIWAGAILGGGALAYGYITKPKFTFPIVSRGGER